MATSRSSRRVGFIARVTVVHVLAYTIVATVVLAIEPSLPAGDRVALEVFAPYSAPGLDVIAWELLRGAVIAVVLLPVADAIVERARGWLLLVAVVAGLIVIGAVAPMPGSIEGVLYTEIPARAHLLILAAAVVQATLFGWVVHRWERRARAVPAGEARRFVPDALRGRLAGHVGRFTLVHLLTYVAAGIVFMQLQDYETVLESTEAFALYRPLDGLVGLAMFPTQVVRGAVLALLLAPFYARTYRRARGYLPLFGLLWGLTYLATPNALRSLLTTVAAGRYAEAAFGTVEITVQMAVFCILVWAWERRALRRHTATASVTDAPVSRTDADKG